MILDGSLCCRHCVLSVMHLGKVKILIQFIQKPFIHLLYNSFVSLLHSVKLSTRSFRIFSMSSGSWMWIGWSLGLITVSHYRCQYFLMSNNIKYSDRSSVILNCLAFLLGQSWLHTTGKHQCGRPRLIPTVYQRWWGQTKLHYHLYPYVSFVQTSNLIILSVCTKTYLSTELCWNMPLTGTHQDSLSNVIMFKQAVHLEVDWWNSEWCFTFHSVFPFDLREETFGCLLQHVTRNMLSHHIYWTHSMSRIESYYTYKLCKAHILPYKK